MKRTMMVAVALAALALSGATAQAQGVWVPGGFPSYSWDQPYIPFQPFVPPTADLWAPHGNYGYHDQYMDEAMLTLRLGMSGLLGGNALLGGLGALLSPQVLAPRYLDECWSCDATR